MTSLQPRRPTKARQVFENEANFVQIKNDPNCFIAKFLRKNVIFTQKGFIIYSVNFHQVCQHFSVNISWKHCKVGTGILGRQTNTSKKSMEGNFVKCFSSPTEHALLETSQQLLSRFQTARTNRALFHNVYNLNVVFFLHRYQCLTGFQKTRWRAFIQRLQRIMCPHGPTGRHHPRYICGAWRRTSGGRFLNHQKHQHYAGQCLTNHGQTFSEVSNGNRATCGIFPRRVAQLT